MQCATATAVFFLPKHWTDSAAAAAILAADGSESLNEYSALLKSLNTVCKSHYSKLDDLLAKKRKADQQINWRAVQNVELKKLKERLTYLKKKLAEDKAKVSKESNDLKLKYGSLELAFSTMKNKQTEVLDKLRSDLMSNQRLVDTGITPECIRRQAVVIENICKLFPMCRVNPDKIKDRSNNMSNQICNARLPRGLDPHSVPPEELAASLGYMVQLLNLIAPNLAAPVLHNSGFAGSCSRIWQRNSYWDARPSSQSKEYPLFIPRQNFCSSGGESWSDRSSLNFGVASVESERRPHLESSRNSSFNYSLASPHSLENHTDLQKGILLLKKSVACITAYSCNSLGLDIPSEASTFEAFGKLLFILSSSKELQSIRNSLKTASSSTEKQAQQLKRSVWNVSSSGSSSNTLAESEQTITSTVDDDNLQNPDSSFMFAAVMINKSESIVEGWNIIEHPTLPPPPSKTEDVEHWMRAMFIDATKK
ncbi:hypothetical protein ZIOFF_032271 [Zingiber officinale]|uniref:Uncharacterized protein n=1 Tax=Zingiber officinale TaxID=94328 RepID=A0A8J5GVB8_ZINOF|nr:hypothetical protein ZIOFF_032271 [Zingiber officinale]